ncbi:TRAP transporter small permease [Paracoccus seriniphilus]|uniref:TRAP transporter small permease protein n=1 Tax=Paracoccus seriniphilus TaxID=184748 RepID=A0A239PZS7_9RHOB|nr:TRAP transporter small permease [Paracoccus seriniphilus]WCR16360.1 TRAP transporter small permease [Paracoccus seriniphilus]SNT75755.1 TRAP-type C4-dicarboxylate transport system, small permease component [Paracoccus seriniphilus]
MIPSNRTDALGALARTEGIIMQAMKWAIVIGMAAMVVVVFLQIASRYLLSISLGWSEEVARLLFISIVFLGAAVLARQQAHLTVTVILDQCGWRLRAALTALASLVGLVCSTYLVRGGWTTMLREWDQRTPALQIPMGIIFFIILFAVTLMTLWLFVVTVINIRDVIKGEHA